MATEAELRDAVKWAYRLLLGRQADNDAIIAEHLRTLNPPTISAVVDRFRNSPEFTATNERAPKSGFPAVDFSEFKDQSPYRGEPGFFRDAFGVRTRLSYLPPPYQHYSGQTSRDQGVELLPMHDDVELEGMLQAGRAAQRTFTVMELGAGWGPWVSMGAKIAKRRGLSYRLIAIEGSKGHFDYLCSHMQDNGIDLAKCRLIHGVVGKEDGTARFPVLVDPSLDYGASANTASVGTKQFEELDCYALSSLLADEPIVDIIHCDVQGHETEVLSSAIEVLNRKVRRIVVGTHGRAIEEQLHNLFASNGWRLDKDIACVMSARTTAPVLQADGAQLWINPQLA